MQDSVSIIVPVYQVEKYITQSIASICNQTYQNIEIILVNDGTKDDSIEIAIKILRKNHRKFKVISQQNMGVAAARNVGIKNAKGDWIICIDSDDIVDKRFIEVLVSANLSNQTKIAVTNYKTFKEREDIKFSADSQIEVISQKDVLKAFLTRKLRIIVPAILIGNDFLKSNNLYYNETMKFSEDQAYIWRILLMVNEISYIKNTLYYYCVHDSSIMTSSTAEEILSGYEGIKKLNIELGDNLYPVPEYIKEYLLPRWILSALRSSPRMLDYNAWGKLAKEMNYKDCIERLKGFPDIKVHILCDIIKVNNRAFYGISKRSLK